MKKKKRKTEHDKVFGAGLEGFVYFTNSIVSESAKERKVEMSSLVVGFATWVHKRAASAEGEATPGSEVLDGKCFKQSGLIEEFHISPVVIFMDSPKRAPSALSALEADAWGASRESCALLEDQAPVREPLLDDEVVNEALHVEEVGGLPPRARWPSLVISKARRTRPPD